MSQLQISSVLSHDWFFLLPNKNSSIADHTILVSFSLLQVYNTMLTNLFFKLQYVFKVSMINMSIYSEETFKYRLSNSDEITRKCNT